MGDVFFIRNIKRTKDPSIQVISTTSNSITFRITNNDSNTIVATHVVNSITNSLQINGNTQSNNIIISNLNQLTTFNIFVTAKANGKLISETISATATTLSSVPNVVTNGLIAYYDAGNTASYPGSGTTWFDISGQGSTANLNLINVSFTSAGTASYFNFSGNNDSYMSSGVSQSYRDLTAFIWSNSFSTGTSIRGLVSSGVSSDKSLRYIDGSFNGRNPGDLNDWANPSATTYYHNSVVNNNAPGINQWYSLGGYRTNFGGNFPTSFNLHVASGYPGRFWHGRVAVLLMYNRQLSAGEQLQNFNAFRSRYGL